MVLEGSARGYATDHRRQVRNGTAAAGIERGPVTVTGLEVFEGDPATG